jgi:hypothetical protein
VQVLLQDTINCVRTVQKERAYIPLFQARVPQ